jgi:hypothetical protein
MTDLTKLGRLTGLRPHGAQQTPTCALCGVNPTEKVADGILPDGQLAGFVPTCQSCYDSKKSIKDVSRKDAKK